MKIDYQIKMLEYWQSSSGLGHGSAADSETIKDRDGLPYLPGKTIKGLWREAMQTLVDAGHLSANQGLVNHIMGSPAGDGTGSVRSHSHWSNASLAPCEKNDIIKADLSKHLYTEVASTAMDEKGLAKDGSLRVAQVCIPVTLHGSIHIELDDKVEDEKIKSLLSAGAKMIRRLGMSRNRGLGRCHVTLKADKDGE